MILSLRNSPSFKHIKSSRDRSNRMLFLFKPTVFGALYDQHDGKKKFSNNNRTYKSFASTENGVATE